MQIFFVSVRTALIYGPGNLLEVQKASGDQLYIRIEWPYAYGFDEWEGYAVVVPERDEVWGLSHPHPEAGELETEFPYTPRPIPRKDRKLFPRGPGSGAVSTDTDPEWNTEEDEDTYQPDITRHEDTYQPDITRHEDTYQPDQHSFYENPFYQDDA